MDASAEQEASLPPCLVGYHLLPILPPRATQIVGDALINSEGFVLLDGTEQLNECALNFRGVEREYYTIERRKYSWTTETNGDLKENIFDMPKCTTVALVNVTEADCLKAFKACRVVKGWLQDENRSRMYLVTGVKVARDEGGYSQVVDGMQIWNEIIYPQVVFAVRLMEVCCTAPGSDGKPRLTLKEYQDGGFFCHPSAWPENFASLFSRVG